MNAITVHPRSAEELQKLEALLIELEIPFENQSEINSKVLVDSIERGLSQLENGDFIDFENFRNKFSLP